MNDKLNKIQQDVYKRQECIYRENLYLIAAPGVVKEEDLADPIHNIVRDTFLRSQPFIPVSYTHLLKDISQQVGYYNVSSFIRRFKQIEGMTPGDYRKYLTGSSHFE